MKRLFIFVAFFLFSLFPVLAQFQRLDFEETPYFNFDFSNSIACYNIDHDEIPISMVAAVTFVTKYFSPQIGFGFGDNEANLCTNLLGYYPFDFGLTVGGIAILNANFYYHLANELDYAGLVYVSYKTKKTNYWKVCLEGGYGGMTSWIQYKSHGEKKWTEPETAQVLLVDIEVIKKFLEKNMIWFDIQTFSQHFFSFGMALKFALGYSFDFNKSWKAYTELKLNELSFLTTLGALESFEIKLGGCYTLPIGGAK